MCKRKHLDPSNPFQNAFALQKCLKCKERHLSGEWWWFWSVKLLMSRWQVYAVFNCFNIIFLLWAIIGCLWKTFPYHFLEAEKGVGVIRTRNIIIPVHSGFWVKCHQHTDETQLYFYFSSNTNELSRCLGSVMGWIGTKNLKLTPNMTEILVGW